MKKALPIFAAVVLILIGGAAYIVNRDSSTPNIVSYDDLLSLLNAEIADLEVVETPYSIPDYILMREDGSPVKFSEMRPKVLLVNLWASWCAPCQAEMADLDALEAKLGSDAFEVVAVNNDRGGAAKARATLDDWKIPTLKVYADPKMQTAFGLAGGKMPTSLIVDKRGMVRATYLGPLNWASDEAVAFFNILIEEDL